jgi:hypothetical protein
MKIVPNILLKISKNGMGILDKFSVKSGKQCLSPNCNKMFTPKSGDILRGWGLYCSKNCSAYHRELAKTDSKECRKIKLNKIINRI